MVRVDRLRHVNTAEKALVNPPCQQSFVQQMLHLFFHKACAEESRWDLEHRVGWLRGPNEKSVFLRGRDGLKKVWNSFSLSGLAMSAKVTPNTQISIRIDRRERILEAAPSFDSHMKLSRFSVWILEDTDSVLDGWQHLGAIEFTAKSHCVVLITPSASTNAYEGSFWLSIGCQVLHPVSRRRWIDSFPGRFLSLGPHERANFLAELRFGRNGRKRGIDCF